MATFEIQAGPERIELQRPMQYRYVDPERGELVRRWPSSRQSH